MSKTVGFIIGGIVLIGVVFAAMALIDVDVDDAGSLPSVAVDVDGGDLPTVDVDVADVDVGMKETTVKVPDVDVDMEEATISLPTIDITPSDATTDDKEASPEINEGEGDPDDD